MLSLVFALVLFSLGLWSVHAWWWSVAEVLRGFVPLFLILFGTLAIAAGATKARSGSTENNLDSPTGTHPLLLKEDWWAIWLGLAVVGLGIIALFGDSPLLHILSINPGGIKWHAISELFDHFSSNADLYLVQFILLTLMFGGSCHVMGIPFGTFIKGFSLLYLMSIIIFSIGGWANASTFNLEPPLVALVVGLVLANTVQLPSWMNSALRVEYYVKFGIVLLGATFPISLVVSAGPVAIGQATFIAVITCLTIYHVGTRYFGLDRRLAAVISVGGSVCGVSGSMAIAAAVGAKREHLFTSVTLVVVYALIMIIALPFISQALGLAPGVAGAWIGTSEFADAAGFAAASAVGKMAGNEESAIQSFTLMKVIGRDLWIGLWSLIWALVATTIWEERKGTDARIDKREIWRRFPKFVFGFFVASIIVSLITAGADSATFDSHIKPKLIDPISGLRGWAFIFCFLSIGLTTRFRELRSVERGAFSAFSIGVAVNVILGFILSVYVFGDYWAAL
ncbi:MAG: putative sulfate exporter family transporter [Magnetococcales bacterium]|nr:putative sulfate exporter family transporter [Magnetococcales bacterium]